MASDPHELVFADERDPLIGELADGWSPKRIGVCSDGSRWVIRPTIAEYSVYRLSERLDMSVIPETRRFRGGSAQRLVDGALTAHALDGDLYEAVRTPVAVSDLASIIALDVLIGNADRHANNWLVGDDGRLIAIDNEFNEPTRVISLYHAVRPARRTGMLDDAEHAPALIAAIRERFKRAEEALAVDLAGQRKELDEWENDLVGGSPR